jgi:hypothetical protein
VKVELLYFDGCPHWQVVERRLIDALDRLGRPESVQRVKIESLEHAQRVGFCGSPTILVDGLDPFATANTPIGLTCRLYETEDGTAGSPSARQLMRVLTDGHRGPG